MSLSQYISDAVGINKQAMHGLSTFITDIRQCSNKDEEVKRVNKEMAHIRKKFKDNAKLDGYSRKKYIAKILYMYILGYEIDFGYIEAVRLLSSKKFSEKQIGYITLSVVLHEEHEMIPLIINSFKLDLDSLNENYVCLALSTICNIGGTEMSESLVPDVERLLIAKNSTPIIKKKASMCLLRLYQRNKSSIEPTIWFSRVKELLNETDIGFLTSFMSFVNFLASNYPNVFSPLHKTISNILLNSAKGKLATEPYIYHRIPTPWLTIKLLKFIQIFPIPEDLKEAQNIVDILTSIISGSMSPTSNSTDANTKNTINSILFEAIKTAIHLRTATTLSEKCCKILCDFLTDKQSNIKYLSLELLSRFALTIPESLGMIKKYYRTIASSLTDSDISIRRRSLDLVYSISDSKNFKEIVNELLDYLYNLDSNILTDYEIREDIILKIAILAEKHYRNSQWYVDVVMRLISLAGESMSDDIWHRTVKVVVNNKDVQHYAISKSFQEFKKGACNESMIKLAAFLLGEFSYYLIENRESHIVEIFNVMNSKFKTSDENTRAIILSSFIKLAGQYNEIVQYVVPVLNQNTHQMNSELQQRAVEYMSLINLNDDALLNSVCEAIPPFKEKALEEDDSFSSNNSPSKDTKKKKSKNSKSKKKLHDDSSQGSKSPFDSSYSDENISDNEEPINDEKTKALFQKLCLLNQGILYEDEVFQVGIKSEYQKGFGQMAIFFGNKSQSTFNSFTCTVAATAFLSIKIDVPFSSIEPGSQQKALLNIQCIAPYSYDIHPTLSFSYVNAMMPARKTLSIPIPMSKFIEPISVEPNHFSEMWDSIKSPDQSIQDIFKSLHPINVSAIQKLIQLGIRLKVQEGITNNVNNIVACGQFISEKIKATCLVLLETNSNAQMIRMSLKSTNASVSQALKTVLLANLSSPS